MNKCIAFMDDDSKICRYFREYATYRGYECSCYHDAENAQMIKHLFATSGRLKIWYNT